jgi:anti-anti-sigma factor
VLTIDTNGTPEGYLVCRLTGALAVFTEDRLRQALTEAATANRLIIDLSGVVCFDSAGLTALMRGIRRVHVLGGEVVIVCVANAIVRNAGFEGIVAVNETVSEAVACLGTDRAIEHENLDGRPCA